MLKFRNTAATIMFLMSVFVVILNTLAFRRMGREREGFHRICMNKAAANILIGIAFLVWAVPCTYLNAYYLPQRFNVFFGQIVGWGPYLMSGPFTQISLAINRAVAISYPYWFNSHSRQHRVPYTKFALASLWVLSIVLSLPSMKDGCSFVFYISNASWGPMKDECSISLSQYVTYFVMIISAISFSINISSIVKILKPTIWIGSDATKRRRKRMLAQCIIQDCTHTFDCLVNTYVYTFYIAQWFQFLCGAVSALTVIMLDGFLMSVLHEPSKTFTSPELQMRMSTRRGLNQKLKAATF